MDLNDLGSEKLDWRRLKAVITYLPSTSAFARSVHGERALWSTSEHLLAAAVDALRGGNWQRGGGKGRKPRPVPRPGVKDENSRTLGTGHMTIEEAQEFFENINRE